MMNPVVVKAAKIVGKVVTVVVIPLVTDYVQGKVLDAKIAKVAAETVTEVLKKES